ncbi:MAG: transporter substrate-binding domain-containing protein [Actinocatenispora sp.]
MKLQRLLAVAAIGALALGVTGACGESTLDKKTKQDKAASGSYTIVKNPKFAAGSTMAKIYKAKHIKIGVKFDQPGIGYKNPTTGEVEGYDIEIAKLIAGQLGLDYNDKKQVELVETVSKNRETFLENGTVDMVVASYSITDERKALVGFAGPYYETGQDLLIRKADQGKIKGPDDLDGKKVCSVTGSTPLANIEDNYPKAKTVALAQYSDCVTQLQNSTVDVLTTDGAILLGYAAQDPDHLAVVGKPFSTEKYGIGVSKDANDLRGFVNDSLDKSFKDGSWKKAYDNTLGKSGSDAPQPPTLDRY